MKKFFVETNGFNFVAFVDSENKAYIIDETTFNERLTLDVAKNADYSNFDGCETAEECAYSVGVNDNVIDFDVDEYETIIEF